MRSSRWIAGLALAAVMSVAGSARADDAAGQVATKAAAKSSGMALQLAFGASGIKTEWRGDVAGASMLRLAFLPSEYWSLYFLGRLGYATVDQRMLTYVSLGAQVWPFGQLGDVKPYARLSIAHQHEETLGVVKDDPFGALFGIGDGIRHRGGFEGALGLDLPFYAQDDVAVFAGFEGSAVWFYDPRGPTWYAGASALLGVSYAL